MGAVDHTEFIRQFQGQIVFAPPQTRPDRRPGKKSLNKRIPISKTVPSIPQITSFPPIPKIRCRIDWRSRLINPTTASPPSFTPSKSTTPLRRHFSYWNWKAFRSRKKTTRMTKKCGHSITSMNGLIPPLNWLIAPC